MFENYNLECQSDQMRWEYERAMYELAQNQKQDKEQAKELNDNERRNTMSKNIKKRKKRKRSLYSH